MTKAYKMRNDSKIIINVDDNKEMETEEDNNQEEGDSYMEMDAI